MKTIIIKAPETSQDKKTPVLFNHTEHLKFACKACHHEWDGLKSDIQGCSASGCHESLMPSAPKGRPSQDRNVMSATGAYHQACRSCHREYQEEFGSTAMGEPEVAPVSCDGCHPKVFSGEESDEGSFSMPLENIILKPPEGVVAKRAYVDFPHSRHFDLNCEVCHHEWYGIDDVQNCTTSGCHDMTEPDESTRDINDPDNVLYFLTAYHKACYQCHSDLNKEARMAASDQDAPPVRCNECHNVE